jgi:acetyl esterase/lipase
MPSPAVPWLALGVSIVGALLTLNAVRPPRRPATVAALAFFAGWVTIEVAVHHIVWQLAIAAGFVALGSLHAWPGWLALAVTAASWSMLYRCYRTASRAEEVVARALEEALGQGFEAKMLPGIQDRLAPRRDWKHLVLPLPTLNPEVVRERDIVYSEGPGYRMRLDVYRPANAKGPCPTVLQIHGGAWVLGSKNEQGLPLVMHLAAHGWTCLSVNYRLAPRATFPDPLVDLKRALQWIREHGREHGADPDFVIVTGGSAGGHLAALVALTANDPEYQPGFEDVDTSVRGCVAFYGVYDFTNRRGVWPHKGLLRLLERAVMKAPLQAARDANEKASPMSRIHPGAPPFFVIHGEIDTMVPVEEARAFVDDLRAVTKSPVVYAEIPGAQHAFEVYPSIRTGFVIHGVERFLAYLYAEYVAAKTPLGAGGQLEAPVAKVPAPRLASPSHAPSNAPSHDVEREEAGSEAAPPDARRA